jgi:hypothetical protein
MKSAGQVDVDDSRPELSGDLQKRREAEQPGAGDQDCDRPEFTTDLREGLLEGSAIGDIGADTEGHTSLGAKILGDTLRGLLVDVEDGDLESAPTQFVTGRLADAGSTAGHHRHPAHLSRLH